MSTRIIHNEPELQRLVEHQLRNWELMRSMRFEREEKPKAVAPFVAISRQVGSGGTEVARTLGARLNWPVFDRQILHAMAGDDQWREPLYKWMDERDAGWLESMLEAIVADKFLPQDYFPRLTKTILALARGGSAVFLGRAADLILPPHVGLRLRIVAPMPQRTLAHARRNSLEQDLAGREVLRIDRERAEFISHHFHMDVDSPTRCDLLLNMGSFTIDEAVDIILAVMRLRRIIT